MPLMKRCIAEFIGTFWLVFGGCGSAVLTGTFPIEDISNPVGIGIVGVSLAFGSTVLTMGYAIGHIHLSGCHLNPAVSFGLWAGKRFSGSDLLPYIVAQLLGAILASTILFLIASGGAGFTLDNGFAANGFGVHSPGGYPMLAAFLTEFVLTFIFLMIILGARDRAPKGLVPVAMGLSLTLIHLIAIPVTNASVNPARSTAPALFVGGWAIAQLWLFWLAPILGAIAAGFIYCYLFEPSGEEEVIVVNAELE
ncbi:MAG: aquaporin Z [Microcoleaceae cyanobacterium]